MKVAKAARIWIDCHKAHSEKKYRTVILVSY